MKFRRKSDPTHKTIPWTNGTRVRAETPKLAKSQLRHKSHFAHNKQIIHISFTIRPKAMAACPVAVLAMTPRAAPILEAHCVSGAVNTLRNNHEGLAQRLASGAPQP